MVCYTFEDFQKLLFETDLKAVLRILKLVVRNILKLAFITSPSSILEWLFMMNFISQ